MAGEIRVSTRYSIALDKYRWIHLNSRNQIVNSSGYTFKTAKQAEAAGKDALPKS